MRITDSQVHVWGANTPEHPWSVEGMARHGDHIFGADELIGEMDRAGVERVVIVTPSWFSGNSVSLDAAKRYPNRFAVMGTFDFENADPEMIRTWRDQPGMLGVRLNLLESTLHQIYLAGDCEQFFATAEAAGVPLMMYSPGQIELIAEVAVKYPNLKIIIDHLNLASKVRDGELGPAIESLLPMEKFSNVAVKLSTLPLYVTEDFPYPSLFPHIKRVIGEFGVERCMWGSDLTRLKRSYVDCVRMVTEEVDFLSENEKEQLMGGSISHWLEWPLS